MKNLSLILLLILSSGLSNAAGITRAPRSYVKTFGANELRSWIEILGCGQVLASLDRPNVCLDEQSPTVFGFLMAVRSAVNSMSPNDPTHTCSIISSIETKRELLRGQIYRLMDRLSPKGETEEIQILLWYLSQDSGPLGGNNRWNAVTEYCLNGAVDRFNYKYLKIMYLRYIRESVPLVEEEIEKVNQKLKVRLPYNRWDGGELLNDPSAVEKIFESWEQDH